MLKQVILLIILLGGITAAVLFIQNSTLLKSFGYDVVDFVSSFHSKEGDPEFNPYLDVYQDGTINTFDVIKDRYDQEATREGVATGSALLESSNSAEASNSAI